jgi:hypothetical protein
MARFAPVAPIQILEEMKLAGCLGNYHLLLTHHVLEYPDRFRELFKGGDSHAIFMDNSIVELGDAVSDEKVKEACEVVVDSGNNWVYPVLIDVMADGPATIEASTESYDWWIKNGEDYHPMVVLQGNSWETFTQTCDHFLLNPEFRKIAYVGIPRVLVDHIGTRQLAIQYVDAIRPDINVHLLGFSNDVTDDVICCNLAPVEGIDSAVPLRYSYSGGDGLYTPTSVIPPRPADWFEKGTYDRTIFENLEAMRRWVA